MRLCSHCKELRKLSEFGKNANRLDGLDSWCNPCKNTSCKEGRRNNPTRYRALDYRHNRGLRRRFNRLTYAARKRGMSLEVTFDQYTHLVSFPCYYCGSPLSPVGYSLDRINNVPGYSHENLRPCCYFCNRTKNDMTEKEFKQLVVSIHNNLASNKTAGIAKAA